MKKKKLINSYFIGTIRNKAFTLIELLAIIVILAIIAVITVPIILNVIENAKHGSIIDSAYGYKDAVDKYYVTKLSEDAVFELNDTYSVSDGKLIKDSFELDIPFTGIGPTNGTLVYENSELKRGCLTFNDYKVTYDGSKFTGEKGTCDGIKEIEIPIARTIDGVDYYKTEWIVANPVYYNPVTGESCINYHEDNSKTGYNGLVTNGSADYNTANNNSCLKWYAYSEQNGNVNLLLDHNTTTSLAWNSSGRNTSGPSTADNELLGKLQSDTNGWNDILTRNDKYEARTEQQNVDYSGYKARIITAQEIAYITGNESWDEKSTSSSYFYFDSKEGSASATCKNGDTSGCSYGWLYDRTSTSCETYGCLNNSDVRTVLYWTVSSSASSSDRAWSVNEYGNLYNCLVNYYYRGLRPVITVSKSSIFEN